MRMLTSRLTKDGRTVWVVGNVTRKKGEQSPGMDLEQNGVNPKWMYWNIIWSESHYIIYTYTQACIHTYTHVDAHTCTHIHACTHTSTHIHTSIHTSIHAYIHAHTHTHTPSNKTRENHIKHRDWLSLVNMPEKPSKHLQWTQGCGLETELCGRVLAWQIQTNTARMRVKDVVGYTQNDRVLSKF